ncbi:2OG-Fe(II) oxygenase family protein [Brevundimonas staleyi]|uniref:2OG-Fe(II) oxygenase n=1 Tax=Brevundimonas staleyi TaxID=74326 RepID=A0ABW0FMK1_9CAUL
MRAGEAPTLRLNGTLRPDAWRGAFAAHRRLHVPEILTPRSARELHQSLVEAEDWVRCIHLAAGQDVDITMAELDAMAEADRIALEHSLVDSCTDSVKYVFDKIRITSQLEAGGAVSAPMRAIHDFVNAPAFLDFFRRLTGDARIDRADVMATRYLSGHFASAHADELPNAKRLYAYVLNLSPDWRADQGGVLMFLDDDGHVAEGYVPRFNALNVFAVPQVHAVSAVSRLATAPRYSVTGWIHAR